MVQRARTASALNSAAASLAEGTAFGAGSLAWIRHARRREISGRFFCLDFNSRIERYQLIRDRELLHYLDPLRLQSIALDVRHRDPAVDPADAEPVKNIRHQLLKAHVLHTSDALGAAEIAVGGVAAGLSLAGVVDEELGDFTQSSPFLAVVHDDPDTALLRGLDADFDAVNEIRAARADVRTEDIRSIAFVVDAAGDHRARLRKTLDLAEETHRGAADRRPQRLQAAPGGQLAGPASWPPERRATH